MQYISKTMLLCSSRKFQKKLLSQIPLTSIKMNNLFTYTPEPIPEPEAEPRLTFGVEIEFLIATLPQESNDPHEQDPRSVKDFPFDAAWSVREHAKGAFKTIANKLCEANIPAFREDEEPWGVDVLVRKWTMVDDASVDAPEDTPYTFVRCEIRSPPLYFTVEAVKQVQAVCELLTNNYRIICPESAGLHVHVGIENKNFSGSAVQKILASLWTFEPAIESIHPAHRVDNIWCSSVRTQSNLKHLADKHDGGDSTKALTGLLEIHKLVANDRLLWSTCIELANTRGERGAYNFRNLQGVSSMKQTIEFRQHKSTLDPLSVGNWIKLCVGLVDFAHQVPMNILAPFLLMHADDDPEEFQLVHVLKAIGLPPQMLFYGSNELHKHLPAKVRRASQY